MITEVPNSIDTKFSKNVGHQEIFIFLFCFKEFTERNEAKQENTFISFAT